MTFQYRPLRTRSHMMRLLDVLPCPSSSEALLECRVRHVSLDQTPKARYETISYVWGDPTPSHTILVNGRPLKVPANTQQVLRRMALPDETRILWIDAVCINQTDKVERAQQVAMMGKIYSRARRNLAYLGDEDGMTERAKRTFMDLVEEISDEIGQRKDFTSVIVNNDNEWLRASSPIHTVVDGEALCAFFCRPWFSRLWVVQEMVLAPETTCYCGDLEVDLELILQIAAWLGSYHLQHKSKQLLDCNGLYNAVSMWNFHRMFTRSADVQIADMLHHSRDLEASDARDKVFGVLGMCERRIDGAIRARLLTPDYSKSVQQVIQDAVRYSFIMSDDPFYLLRNVSHRDEADLNVDGFPSWVPRFDRKQDLDVDAQALVEHGPAIEINEMARALAEELSDPNALLLGGAVLDEIQDVSPVFDPDTLADFDSGERLFANLLNIVSQHEGQQSRLARTLIADTNHMRSKSSEQDWEALSVVLEHIQAHRRIEPFPNLPYHPGDPEVKAVNYWQALLDASSNRRVATTKRRLLGLVPKISRASDLVVTFQNGRSPFVLRSHGEEFLFLGECYLDGAMPWQDEYQSIMESSETPAEKIFRIH